LEIGALLHDIGKAAIPHNVLMKPDSFNAFREGVFDVVLMDMQMPNMNGADATAEIRHLDHVRGTYTAVIAVTAHAMKGDRERYLAAGMDGYVSKPIRRDLLFQEIAMVTSAVRAQ
jgi:CheY-like chemotaxis protein